MKESKIESLAHEVLTEVMKTAKLTLSEARRSASIKRGRILGEVIRKDGLSTSHFMLIRI